MDLFSIAINFKMWGVFSRNSYDADKALKSLSVLAVISQGKKEQLSKSFRRNEMKIFLGPCM